MDEKQQELEALKASEAAHMRNIQALQEKNEGLEDQLLRLQARLGEMEKVKKELALAQQKKAIEEKDTQIKLLQEAQKNLQARQKDFEERQEALLKYLENKANQIQGIYQTKGRIRGKTCRA